MEQSVKVNNTRRKWWIASLLSLITPGLGQLYNGQPKKAGALYALSGLSALAFFVSCVKMPSLAMLIISGVVIFAISLYIIIEAGLTANNIGDNYYPMSYNKVWVYVVLFILLLFVSNSSSFIIRNYAVRAYRIPAASMNPTLKVGDHVLVDKLGGSAKEPSRGDIIVFAYPNDTTKDFIKRVVGMPGDVVAIKDKKLIINGKPVQEPYVVYMDDNILPETTIARDNFGPFTIPKDSYFVMGDNRDRSHDSRFWGVVSKDKIRGKARVIYWSWDSDEATVRWNRIGKKI